MSLYNTLDFLTGEPAYSSSSDDVLLQAGSGIIYPRLKRRVSARHGYAAFLLFAITAVFFIFSLSTFLFSLPSRTTADSKTASRASEPIFAAAAPFITSSAPQPLEVHVANNGLTLLRGAKVLSVDGTTLTLGMAWGSATFTWTVHTNATNSGTHAYGTRFLDRSGNPSSLENISAGSLVTVTGMLDGDATVSTLDADTVRGLQ